MIENESNHKEESNLKEECLARHRLENKNLQAEIQKLKHSIAKGDKKKKKDVNGQIQILENNLQEKHNHELSLLEQSQKLDSVVNGLSTDLKINEAAKEIISEPKISKTQRKREKKAQKQTELENKIKEESENCPKNNLIELEQLTSILDKKNMEIFEIASDGNCLYAAIAHQLKKNSIESSVARLREQASQFMLKNENDFLPFLIDEESGDMLNHESFVLYCTKVATTSEWGGQAELRALSEVNEVSIEVIQANGPTILIGEQYDTTKLYITYHRHEYGLGEHYNSIVLKSKHLNNS